MCFVGYLGALDQGFTELLYLDTNSSSNCFCFTGLSHSSRFRITSSCLYLEVALRRKSCAFFRCTCSRPTALGKLQHSRACGHVLLPRRLCPETWERCRDVCLPVWFAWQIKVGTEAGAGNCWYNQITTDVKALVSWLLTGVAAAAQRIAFRH